MPSVSETYQRVAHVVARDVDGEIFLIDDVRGRIHSLDAIGSAVWRLLEEPMSVYDMVEVFAQAFPDRKPKQLRKYVADLVADLVDKRVIKSVAPGS